VALALFSRPPTPEQFEFPAAYTSLSDTTQSSFDYRFDQVAPGVYEYLVVAWLAEGVSIFEVEEWVELAVYEEPVEIHPGGLRRIDLVADFGLVPALESAGGGR